MRGDNIDRVRVSGSARPSLAPHPSLSSTNDISDDPELERTLALSWEIAMTAYVNDDEEFLRRILAMSAESAQEEEKSMLQKVVEESRRES